MEEEIEKISSMVTANVHRILAHSYFVYLFLFITGVTLDIIFRYKLFNGSIVMPLGLGLLVLASLLILWAQRTSRNLDKSNLTAETFCRGPYCYTRSPTHWGLFLLLLGFGVISNAFFVVLTTIISFVITKFVFLHKEEEALAKKYGTPYLEYKKIVRF